MAPHKLNVRVNFSIVASSNYIFSLQKIEKQFKLSYTLEELSEGVNALAISSDGISLLGACECPVITFHIAFMISSSRILRQ